MEQNPQKYQELQMTPSGPEWTETGVPLKDSLFLNADPLTNEELRKTIGSPPLETMERRDLRIARAYGISSFGLDCAVKAASRDLEEFLKIFSKVAS